VADEETPTTPRRKHPPRKPAAVSQDSPIVSDPSQTPTQAPDPTPDSATNQAPGQSETNALLRQLLDERKQDRAELAALRQEFAQARVAAPAPRSATPMSAEELMAERLREIEEHSFYCPGCGALYNRERECIGRLEAPHPAIEVVSTDELKGDDPSRHTEAPGVRP